MKKVKKVLALIALFAIILVPTIAWASSYNSTLSFNSTLKGQTRSFDGSDIKLSMTCGTSGNTRQASKYFTVTLYRQNKVLTDRIGTVNFLRTGDNSTKWTSVGSGKYYFYFDKAIDGVKVSSTNVSMTN